MRTGAVGAVHLVAGFAFGKDFFAFRNIRRGQKLVKAHLDHLFCRGRILFARGNHIGLGVFALMTCAAHRVDGSPSPIGEKEDQEGAAEAADDLGDGHSVEHVAFRLYAFVARYLPASPTAFQGIRPSPTQVSAKL